MAFRKPNPWGWTQPPIGSSINWGDPLAQGLFVCALFNEGAGVARNIGPVGAGFGTPASTRPTWRPYGAMGRGQFFDTAGTTYVDIPGKVGSTTFLTYVLGFTQRTAAAALDIRLLDNADSDNNPPSLQNLAGGTTWRMQFASSATGGNVTIGFPVPIGVYQQHVITVDGSITDLNGGRCKWYVNGVPQTVTVVTNGDGVPTDTTTRVGGIVAAARSFDGIVHHFYKFRRVLKPNEARTLYTEPYRFFVAPRRHFSAAAAAGGGITGPLIRFKHLGGGGALIGGRLVR